jgi:hypothetical protein
MIQPLKRNKIRDSFWILCRREARIREEARDKIKYRRKGMLSKGKGGCDLITIAKK